MTSKMKVGNAFRNLYIFTYIMVAWATMRFFFFDRLNFSKEDCITLQIVEREGSKYETSNRYKVLFLSRIQQNIRCAARIMGLTLLSLKHD